VHPVQALRRSQGRVVIYVFIALLGALCTSLATSLILTTLLLSVRVVNDEGSKPPLRTPEWWINERRKA
jgi:hypothetical protein